MYDARPERGIKRTCLHCESRFYDLTRSPILCPKCGTEFVEVVRPPLTPRHMRKNNPFGKDRATSSEEGQDIDNSPPAAAESEDDEEREVDGDEAEDLADDVEHTEE